MLFDFELVMVTIGQFVVIIAKLVTACDQQVTWL